MRHRLKRKIFDSLKNYQQSRTSSTFTLGKNPHLAKNKLHSKSTYFYRWCVPGICGMALLFGGVVAINPYLSINQAHAEELDFAVDNITSSDDSNNDGIMLTANTTPTVSLTLTQGAASQQTPAEAGVVKYRNNIFTVGGSGMVKYAVSLHTPSGKTGELVGRNNPYVTVGKVAANTSTAKFPDNTWGYAISALNDTSIADASMTYNPVPSGTDGSSNSVQLAKRNEIVLTSEISDSYKIAFAAKLGEELPADHYEAQIYLSVIASASALNYITTMQEMSNSICSSSSEGAEAKLRDTRDNKIYYVTKLKDGNCWMTQNLAYDSGGEKRCTVDFSAANKCTNWPSSTDNTNPYYAVGSHTDADHASKGNYYNWQAAVNNSTDATEPKQGICPDGWQLPAGGKDNTNSKSFGGLTEAYDISSNSASSAKLRDEPLYFVYGGDLYNGSLGNSDPNTGNYWSSTPDLGSNIYAHYLHLDNSSVQPFVSYYRYRGYFVRCVAQ